MFLGEEKESKYALTQMFQDQINDIFEASKGGKIDGDKLDLDALAPEVSLTDVCMDLMMYKQPELFEASFSLLLAQFAQRRPVIEALQDVILLKVEDLYKPGVPLSVYWEGSEGEEGKAELQHVRHLRSFRQLLRRGCEAYELWAISDEETGRYQDATWFKQILGYLVLFVKFPLSPGLQGKNHLKDPITLIKGEKVLAIADFHETLPFFDFGFDDRSQNPDRPKFSENNPANNLHQDLLRGMQVHHVLLNATFIPFHKFDEKRTVDWLAQVICGALKGLSVFVTRNPKNQDFLFQRIDDLLDLLTRARKVSKNPDLATSGQNVTCRVVELLTETMCGNEHLIHRAPHKLWEDSIRLLFENPFRLRYLRFFQVVSSFGGIIGKKTVVNYLAKRQGGRQKGSILELDLKIAQKSAPYLSKEQIMMFQARLYSMLANNCNEPDVWDSWEDEGDTKGQLTEGYVIIQSSLQAIISLDDLLRHLKEIAFPPLRAALLRCVTALYLNTPKTHASVKRNQALYDLIDKLVDKIDDLMTPGGELTDEQAFELSWSILPCLDTYFRVTHRRNPHPAGSVNDNVRPLLTRMKKDLPIGSRARDLTFNFREKLDKNLAAASQVTHISSTMSLRRSIMVTPNQERDPSMWADGRIDNVNGLDENTYYDVMRDICKTDHGVIQVSTQAARKFNEDRSQLIDMNGVSKTNLDVTGSHILIYQFQKLEKDKNAKEPGAVVTYANILTKMIDHVSLYLGKECDSGFDTVSINIQVMQILTQILEDMDPEQMDFGNASAAVTEDRTKIMRERYELKQEELTKYGAMNLVLQVLTHATPENSAMFGAVNAALELGCKLLENGPKFVQDKVIKFFRARRNGHVFFQNLSAHMRDLQRIVSQDKDFLLKYGSAAGDEQDTLGGDLRWIGDKQTKILRFLQLWAEGHNNKMQEFMRNQLLHSQNRKSFNLLADAVRSFDRMTSDTDRLRDFKTPSLEIILQHVEFLVECLQGPCEGNQDFVIEETSLVVYVKRILKLVHSKGLKLRKSQRSEGHEGRHTGPANYITFKDADVQSSYVQLLAASCKLLQAVMEARGGDEKIHYGVAEQMNIKLFHEHMKKIYSWVNNIEMVEDLDSDEKKEMKDTLLGAAYDLFSVFMQLGSVDKSIMRQLFPRARKGKIDEAYKAAYGFIEKNIVRVEFFWKVRP